jgi:hypothetical protein
VEVEDAQERGEATAEDEGEQEVPGENAEEEDTGESAEDGEERGEMTAKDAEEREAPDTAAEDAAERGEGTAEKGDGSLAVFDFFTPEEEAHVRSLEGRTNSPKVRCTHSVRVGSCPDTLDLGV